MTATAFSIALCLLLWGEYMKWLMIILTAMFVAAKLAHVITWSWWLVSLPLWIYLGLVVLIYIIVFVVEVLNS